MDRDAIAKGQRRRQAEEALEVERDRMAMLEGLVEDLVTELIGTRIDDEAFATMQPEEVETMRSIFHPQSEYDTEEEHEVGDEWDAAENEATAAAADPSTPEEDEDPAAETEAEIARLEAEVADSRRRQAALESYLEALDRK